MGSRRSKLIVVITLSVVLLGALAFLVFRLQAGGKGPSGIVIRIDDIQDYYLSNAQLALIQQSEADGVPLSLAVIPGAFGEDDELVNAVKGALQSGSEVAVHGWDHEDLTQFSKTDQEVLLFRGKARIKSVLGYDTSILVPPMFSFNQDTLNAMQAAGFNVISSDTTVPDGTVKLL